MRALDQPGRVIKRCVLEHLRTIRVQFEDGVSLLGRVERVHYDPKQGRVCTVSLDSQAPVSTAPRLTEPRLRGPATAIRSAYSGLTPAAP
jgi:hypothetical protein